MHRDRPELQGGHLILQLKPGWSYNHKARRFVSEEMLPAQPVEGLPGRTRILPVASDLNDAEQRDLSEEEGVLARTFNVLPPAGTPLDSLRDTIQGWPCTELVWVAPDISLPG